jgi:N-acetylglucosamine malate deacetylase 2
LCGDDAALRSLIALLCVTQTELLERVCAGSDDDRPAPAAAIIVAHPDDEVTGAGARLKRLRGATLIHVTDGAPRDGRDAAAHGFVNHNAYARARRCELESALVLIGFSMDQTRAMGCLDQESSFQLVTLSRRIAILIEELKPEVVLTHAYEGGHPDHDATAFAVHAACRLVRDGGAVPPAIIEMTSYHNSASGIETYTFLPNGDPGVVIGLTEPERELKRRMMACFTTQQETLQYFPVMIERFRLSPTYDFTLAPHSGLLFYELFSWGMTGERFRGLAREALCALEIRGLI